MGSWEENLDPRGPKEESESQSLEDKLGKLAQSSTHQDEFYGVYDQTTGNYYPGSSPHASNINSFMLYLGWKTLAWALVFLGVMLVIKFLRLWLLHQWIRETTRELQATGDLSMDEEIGRPTGSGRTTTELERSRQDALRQIYIRMHQNERNSRRLILLAATGELVSHPGMAGRVNGSNNLNSQRELLLDAPPVYDEALKCPKAVSSSVVLVLDEDDDDASNKKYDKQQPPKLQSSDSNDRSHNKVEAEDEESPPDYCELHFDNEEENSAKGTEPAAQADASADSREKENS